MSTFKSLRWAVALVLTLPVGAAEAQEFRRGDADGDGVITITDASRVIHWLLGSDAPPPCSDAADADDSGGIDVSDMAAILQYLSGDPLAPDLSGACVVDGTPDALGCSSYGACPDKPVSIPDPQHVLRIGDHPASVSSTTEVPVYYDNDSAGGLAALSLGVAHDETQVDLLQVEMGVDLASRMPAIQSIQQVPGGWRAYFIIDLYGSESVPAGVGYELYRATYQLAVDRDAAIVFSDQLGDPVLPIRADIHGGAMTVLPTVVDGTLHVARFRRGDANGDSSVNIADAIFLLLARFIGGDPPACRDAADVNDDGVIDLADPISVLGGLFVPASVLPPLPGPYECGVDPTPDGLDCGSICL